MENSFDDVSCVSPQNLGSSSPGKKQSKENNITVSGSRRARACWVASWGCLWSMARLLPWQCGPLNGSDAQPGTWEVPKLGCCRGFPPCLPPALLLLISYFTFSLGASKWKDCGWNGAEAIFAGQAGEGMRAGVGWRGCTVLCASDMTCKLQPRQGGFCAG